jgi:type IV pilus assembly protein PilA
VKNEKIEGAAMRQCPNCKNNIADFVTVCPYCGAGIGAAPLNPALANPAQAVFAGPPEKSGKATASLVCGILLCLSPFTSVAAVILGHLALSDIKKSAGRMAGHGMALAGLILGYIGLAMVPLTLIIAAIAIPNILRAKMAANEASAVGTLRTYNTAMITYSSACPDIGYPQSLENLGPGTKDCSRADLVETALAKPVPVKNGYRFFYTVHRGANGLNGSYVISADPISPATSGVRHFFTDESGVLRYSVRGGADADSEPLQ